MTLKDTWELYQEGRPDGAYIRTIWKASAGDLDAYLVSGKNHWEIEYRLLKGNGVCMGEEYPFSDRA